MLKKFVPLNANASPSQNPYEVRTYMGDSSKLPEWNVELCSRERTCPVPVNSTISKVMTIEDELRRLHQKAKESRFQRTFKKKCDATDIFTMCVVPQRTPGELKIHAEMRENYLHAQQELQRHVHDASEPDPNMLNLVQLESPMPSRGGDEEDDQSEDDEEEEEEGEPRKKHVRPKLASPSCSLDMIYVPPRKLLELERPKSGMFHNQTEPPLIDDEYMQFSTYNPRMLQEQFNAQGLRRIDIIPGKEPDDLWTWNIGVQHRESDLNRAMIEAATQKFDCANLELSVYNIPKDLDKTFTAEIVFGNDAIKLEPIQKRRFYNRPKEIACIFIAFVESFRLNPDFWTAETMDDIFKAGAKLLKRSTDLLYKSDDTDFDILPQMVAHKAVIGLKVHFTGPLKDEPNIYKTLSLYFSKYNAAVVCSSQLYLLIWKRCKNSFYVFDPNGRNELCQRDFEKGKCSLLATRYVEHLVHLIINFSQMNNQEDFNLYEIYLTNYGKIVFPPPTKPGPKRSRKIWAVVNSTYAIIPGANNGLQQPNTGNERNASMIISLLAMLYSDIERAVLWRMDVIDELIKYGKAYFKSITKNLFKKKKLDFNVVDLPEGFMLGAFVAFYKKRPFLYTGHVADCKNYIDSQLIVAVKGLFTSKWEAGLLQIDNCVIALWRDKEYFYVFDPFRRGKAGQVLDPEDFLTKGVACLQMHTNFDSFCRILYVKAIKMRRGGKFFLHGINVGCIKIVPAVIGKKNFFPLLKLTPEKFRDDPEVDPAKAGEEGAEGEEKKEKEKVEEEQKAKAKGKGKNKKGKGKGKGKGKRKGKKRKAEKKHSIRTIPEEDRIPEYEEADVALDVLEEILCEILQKMPEPAPMRQQLYKHAERVLLRSDKAYLETMKYRLKHGDDYDNIYEAFPMHPQPPVRPITLEEELLLPSNYEILPDGAWVIFGTSQLPALDDEMSKLSGLLAVLVAAALTAKYKISTWNSELVEFALESTNSFSEEHQNYQNLIAAMIARRLPRISIGMNTYNLCVEKIFNSDNTHSLRQVLLECLMAYTRLIVVCQHFSCGIFKRYNFLYMFVGFPCTPVGFRRFGSGPGCVLRFVELDALIRRIELGCNPQGCEVNNYVVVALHVFDVTSELPERFKEWSQPEQHEMYMAALKKRRLMEHRKLDKIHFLDEELRKEDERIQDFFKAKKAHMRGRQDHAKICKAKKKPRAIGYQWETEMGVEEGEMENEEEGEEEETVELKHKPGVRLPRYIPHKYRPRPILFGYHMRKDDCLFKIQGSIALEARAESAVEEIKPCFFISALAILFAVLRPLNQWTSQRIDRVVNNGKAIASKVSNMMTSFERVIKNVTVDDYEFDVLVRTFEPLGVWGVYVDNKIEKATCMRHYLMLQLSNCTYAIYHDQYYHLFDPYASMETLQADEGDDGGNKKCPKKTKLYPERNSASWVLFADIESMMRYVDARAANPDWKEINEFQLHVLDIVSYKKATPKAVILQLLTDLSVPMTCKVSQHGEDETYICAHSENLNWLDLENCLPVWSRMNRRNTSGRYRNLPVTKLKKFDIEIEGRLWSLWGNLHPSAPVFKDESRGKQFLACNVVACCAAMIYPLTEWSPHLLDTIVISGDKYHRESLANIRQHDYEFSLEDLNLECTIENLQFVVHLEHAAYGKLYCTPTYTRMNLAEALMYFFAYFQFGILQCHRRSLAIGRTMGHDGGYFMFDCQSRDYPLFPKGQGASYILRTKHLQVLLYCIVVTLNVPYYNMAFSLHKVDMLREGTSAEEEEDGVDQ